MADSLGVSERHLRRVFRDVTGVGPKTFAKLARFRHAVRDARAEPHPNWARIAATESSTMLAGVQSWRQPAMPTRNASSTAWPYSEWPTSGCHWTPRTKRLSGSSTASIP